ncbi:MAG: efflux RND transporter permease subunit [candidate division NC10 bacterium]|nr:efflux RND transporter permease subunit [candidate division NC10 bacterium]
MEVARRVRDVLPLISARLPGSVRVTLVYDRSRTIVNAVHDVQVTLLIAFVLVVAVIFLFLGRARDTLIPTVCSWRTRCAGWSTGRGRSRRPSTAPRRSASPSSP